MYKYCQPYAPTSFTPQENIHVLISIRGWVIPDRPEGLCKWNRQTTPSGIEIATYWLLVQCLNQLRNKVKLEKNQSICKSKDSTHKILPSWGILYMEFRRVGMIREYMGAEFICFVLKNLILLYQTIKILLYKHRYVWRVTSWSLNMSRLYRVITKSLCIWW
jgi:hypothetical protein